ncbi:hypothetical protein ACWDTI_00360 [Gordonia sp. NPDC003424]
MSREIVLVAGCGEKLDHTMVAYNLCKQWFRPTDQIVFLKYENSIGPVNSNSNPLEFDAGLNEALKDCEERLVEYVGQTPNVPLIVGYSEGAYGLSNFLESLHAGRYPDLEVDGALLIASPRAFRRNNVEGIAGAHGAYPALPKGVWGLSNIRDGIASTPVNSVLRKLPGIVGLFTTNLPDIPNVNWMEYFIKIFVQNNFAPSLNDLKLIQGYLNGSTHVSQYFSDPKLNSYPAKLLA